MGNRRLMGQMLPALALAVLTALSAPRGIIAALAAVNIIWVALAFAEGADSWVDGALRGCGALLMLLVLIGLLLNVAQVALTPNSWGYAWAAVSVLASSRPRRLRAAVVKATAIRDWPTVGLLCLALVVTVAAIAWAKVGARSDNAPVAQLGVASISGGSVSLVITAGPGTRSYQLRGTGPAGQQVVVPIGSVSRGVDIERTIVLTQGRWQVRLVQSPETATSPTVTFTMPG